MTERTCLLCGDTWGFDDAMCCDCEDVQQFPKRLEPHVGAWGSFGGFDSTPTGDYVRFEDVLWLVALWRLIESVDRDCFAAAIAKSPNVSSERAFKFMIVLDKLAEFEQEAKG